jgi:hypothetical protein
MHLVQAVLFPSLSRCLFLFALTENCVRCAGSCHVRCWGADCFCSTSASPTPRAAAPASLLLTAARSCASAQLDQPSPSSWHGKQCKQALINDCCVLQLVTLLRFMRVCASSFDSTLTDCRTVWVDTRRRRRAACRFTIAFKRGGPVSLAA